MTMSATPSGSRISQQSNLRTDWGYSVRDIRQRFVSYFLYQLPQNLTTSVIFSANSGRAFDVLSGDDDDNDGEDDADRGIVDASNRARVDAIGQDQLPDGLQLHGAGRQPSFYNFDWRLQWSP